MNTPEQSPDCTDLGLSIGSRFDEQPLPDDLAGAQREIERLRRESRLDELTGFPNLRYLNEEFSRRAAAAERNGGKVSVLMIDLPGLKDINDHGGHDVGDRVLRTFSRVLDGNCRGTDMVARVGGDEFAVLLEGEKVGPYLDRLDDDLEQGYPHLPGPTEYYLGYGLFSGTGEQDPAVIDQKRAEAFAEAQRNLSQDKRRQKESGPVA